MAGLQYVIMSDFDESDIGKPIREKVKKDLQSMRDRLNMLIGYFSDSDRPDIACIQDFCMIRYQGECNRWLITDRELDQKVIH